VPLLDERLSRRADRSAWPAEFLVACHEEAMAGVAAEMLQQRELMRVLEALAKAGVRPVLFKGAALAYSHYPRASLRPRNDADLLVPEAAVAAAGEALAALGYARKPGVTGELIAYQSCWTRADAHGPIYQVDLHWKVNNAQALASALDYEDLSAHCVAVAALGPYARAPEPAYALLLACMHRAGHMGDPHFAEEADHPGGDRLVWLYDMHLLLSRMSAAECDEFVALAARKRMRAVCRDALLRARACFDTPIPPSVAAGLDPHGDDEPSARLLDGRPALRMLGDFRAIEGMAGRARWLRELFFPPATYMRQKYPDASFAWLPWLYLRRALHGAWKLLSPLSRPREGDRG
jgi:hypothetical protein